MTASTEGDAECPGPQLLVDLMDKLAALRAALIEGEQSGPSAAFDLEAFIARKRTTPSPAVLR